MSFDPASLVIPAIGVGIAVVSLINSYMRASKGDVDKIRDDAVKLEHRLTLMETNQFTNVDRACLQETNLKIGLFWEAVKEDFPSLLKKTNTPRLDALLDKAQCNLESLSSKESLELFDLLTHEIEEAKAKESPQRAAIAAFYRSVLKYEILTRGIKNESK